VLDEEPVADPVGEVVDMQHGRGFVPRRGGRGKGAPIRKTSTRCLQWPAAD
jgi:hypothetical protein